MKRRLFLGLIIGLIMVTMVAIPSAVMAVSPTPTPVAGYTNAAQLEDKDASWAVVGLGTGKTAVLSYNANGATFAFNLVASGLEASTAYSLIYYADPYPGNSPGALIAIGTSDASGGLTITGSPELNMNLPTPPDTNMTVSHAGAPDNYTHPFGAKVWLVPSACYDATLKKVSTWTQTRFLFETDLITYTDTNLAGGTGVALTTTITATVPTIGMGINPVQLNFGSVVQGADSAEVTITLSNTGNVPIKATATTSTGFYADCLLLKPNGGAYTSANGWMSPSIPVGGNLIVTAKVHPTTAYSGTLTGTVSFIASFAP
jgi:hypothetical protein